METMAKDLSKNATKPDIVDRRIDEAIKESEKIIKNNPKWVTLEQLYEDMDKV